MASCLGLYIEDYLIKYAKVTKDHDNLKVESYGITFYDSLSKTIEQIIEETNSQNIPISINLFGEEYKTFSVFSLLSKSDIAKAIQTEFESYSVDKGLNPKAYASKYALTKDQEDSDKLRVIHVSTGLMEINKDAQDFSKYKLGTITPLPIAITNLIQPKPKENYLIVNIEKQTTLTTIVNQNVFDVQRLEFGSEEILNKINEKENSYSKSYEICKNTTIFSSDTEELIDVEVNHLENIMITLNNIVSEVNKIINSGTQRINTIFITGTGALINNVDLYFEEYVTGAKCKLLKPYFIRANKGVNVKDYIEVNSAIALALTGLGNGIQGLNFGKQSTSRGLAGLLKMEIGSKKGNGPSINIKNDFGEPLDKVEKNLIRSAVGILLLFIIFSVFSFALNKGMNSKSTETDELISNITQEISKVESDNTKIISKTNEYTSLIQSIEDANDKITDETRNRNVIPNLLNFIMYIVPENVQITSIQNTTDRHIEITAQSDKYEQLGYLKARIKSEVMLTNVISTAGQKDGGVVTVKIEGDLP